MINTNELRYSDFEILCKEINRNIRWYEDSRNYAIDMEFCLYLSNGERINYSIPRSSIAHLLGINTEEIKIHNIYQTKNSYNIIKLVCDDVYTFHNALRRNNVPYKSIVSPYIDTKIKIFTSHFLPARDKINNIEFICKYNRNHSYINGEDNKNVDYIIATRDGDLLTLLGLIKNNYDYIPITSQMIDLKKEEGKNTLSSFIKNQILLLPETLITKKGYREESGYLYDEVLLEKLENLEQYTKEYGCIIDVSNSLKYSKKKEIDSRVIATAVCESMVSGKPIEEVEYRGKVPKYLQDLLIYTKSLQPVSRKGEIKRLNELKEMALEIEKLKEENKRLTQDNNNLNSAITNLNKENDTLRKNNEENNIIFGQIKKLIKNK